MDLAGLHSGVSPQANWDNRELIRLNCVHASDTCNCGLAFASYMPLIGKSIGMNYVETLTTNTGISRG